MEDFLYKTLSQGCFIWDPEGWNLKKLLTSLHNFFHGPLPLHIISQTPSTCFIFFPWTFLFFFHSASPQDPWRALIPEGGAMYFSNTWNIFWCYHHLTSFGDCIKVTFWGTTPNERSISIVILFKMNDIQTWMVTMQVHICISYLYSNTFQNESYPDMLRNNKRYISIATHIRMSQFALTMISQVFH